MNSKTISILLQAGHKKYRRAFSLLLDWLQTPGLSASEVEKNLSILREQKTRPQDLKKLPKLLRKEKATARNEAPQSVWEQLENEVRKSRGQLTYSDLEQLAEKYWDRAAELCLRKNFILIYQPGKIGSQTIELTLQQCLSEKDTVIIRLHILSVEKLQRMLENTNHPHIHPTIRFQNYRNIAFALLARQLIEKRKQIQPNEHFPPIRIITAIREPIGARIAAIFQNHHAHASDPADLTPEKVRNIIQKKPAFHWFSQEFNSYLNLNIHREGFDPERGWKIYSFGWTEILFFQFEIFSQLPQLLSEFFHISPPPIFSRNRSEQKEYATAYQRVKNELKIDPHFLEQISQLPDYQLFYSSQQRARWADQWCTS